jgi:hypothetical protein
MKKNILIFLLVLIIIIVAIGVYQSVRKNKIQKEIELTKQNDREYFILQAKSKIATKKLLDIYDIAFELNSDSSEFFRNEALKISISMIPVDSILIQLTEIENRINVCKKMKVKK